MPNQRIFNEWIQRIKDVKLSMVGADIVFLPIKQTYSQTEFCGSGGTLRVILFTIRLCLKNGRTFSKIKLLIAGKIKISIPRRKFGLFCIVW